MTHNAGQFTCQGCYVLPLNNMVCNIKEKISFMTGSDVRIYIYISTTYYTNNSRSAGLSCAFHRLTNYFHNFSLYFRKNSHLCCLELNRFSLSR